MAIGPLVVAVGGVTAALIIRGLQRRRQQNKSRPTPSLGDSGLKAPVAARQKWRPRCDHHGCKDEEGRWPEGTRNLYVIRLHDAIWTEDDEFRRRNPNHRSDQPCVYVGQTAHRPACRLEHHLNRYKHSRRVTKYGRCVMPEVYEHENPVPADEAEKREEALALSLQKRGWGVWWN